jgi:hypothetical protein
MTRWLLAVGLAAATVGTGGCGGEPVGMVSGLVTLDGKPVDGGTVSFLPPAGGVPVTTLIGSDGRYVASGVPVGEVMVGVQAPGDDSGAAGEIIKNQGAKGGPQQAPPKPAVRFPDRYADPSTSGLKVTVKPEKDGQVTFDIPMKK